MYTLTIASYIARCTSSPYLSWSQDRRKWAPTLVLNSYNTGFPENPKFYITIIRSSCWLMREAMKKLPGRGRWNKKATSSKVIVISPNGRRKKDVSLCHRLTKDVNNETLSMVCEQSTNERRPQSSTIAMTFYGIRASKNFFSFAPWVGTFCNSQSCNKQSKNHKLFLTYQ